MASPHGMLPSSSCFRTLRSGNKTMDPETQLLALAHVQTVARQFLAWRGSLEALIAFVAYSMGESAPSPERLDNFLRRESTQTTLAGQYETALYRATDKTYRLICLATTTDPVIACKRLAHRPASPGTQCAFCLIDEKGFASIELQPELDVYRLLVPGRYLHRCCQRPWARLRALAERTESESG